MDYVLLDEVDSLSMGNSLQWDGFNPFREVIGRGQYKLVAFERIRVYLIDYIYPPASERPRFDDQMKLRCWCVLHIAEPLTILATLVVSEAAF